MAPKDLKAWREHNTWTQQTAADALGISRRTLISYEQGLSEIPLAIEYACKWLNSHPDEIEPHDRFRIGLSEGGTAGAREVAIASMSLIKCTLTALKAADVVSSEMLLKICNAAITEHNENPTGDQPWTQPVVRLIRDAYYDLEPSKKMGRIARMLGAGS